MLDPESITLFAYVGLGPGQEFIPQFMALLAVAGTALLAILQWPFVALFRRLSRNGRIAATPSNGMMAETRMQDEQCLKAP